MLMMTAYVNTAWVLSYKMMMIIAVMRKGEPMTENERKTIMILADTIQGEINRMCVTKELSEFDTMYGHAKKNLEKLSKMIYDARFKTERRTVERGR